MFTGIIEELGAVLQPAPRLVIACRLVLEDVVEGASIAVNGVCLTAVDVRRSASFTADLAPETLLRSNLGHLQPGSRVNLERPLLATGRIDGHFVQGHVEATGELVSLEALGDGNWWLKVRVPDEIERYLIHKGSIAIDGISLTIAELEGNLISVAIIPHTYRNTTLGEYKRGARVNLECDLIAKYVEKMMHR